MVLLKDDFRDTALHLSACHGEVGIVKLLLARGADVDAENNLGSTPLNRAAVAGRTEVRLSYGDTFGVGAIRAAWCDLILRRDWPSLYMLGVTMLRVCTPWHNSGIQSLWCGMRKKNKPTPYISIGSDGVGSPTEDVLKWAVSHGLKSF